MTHICIYIIFFATVIINIIKSTKIKEVLINRGDLGKSTMGKGKLSKIYKEFLKINYKKRYNQILKMGLIPYQLPH